MQHAAGAHNKPMCFQKSNPAKSVDTMKIYCTAPYTSHVISLIIRVQHKQWNSSLIFLSWTGSIIGLNLNNKIALLWVSQPIISGARCYGNYINVAKIIQWLKWRFRIGLALVRYQAITWINDFLLQSCPLDTISNKERLQSGSKTKNCRFIWNSGSLMSIVLFLLKFGYAPDKDFYVPIAVYVKHSPILWMSSIGSLKSLKLVFSRDR